jgi:hypothetical protein
MNEESPKVLNYNNLSNKEITKEVLENLINFNLSSYEICRRLKRKRIFIYRLMRKFDLKPNLIRVKAKNSNGKIGSSNTQNTHKMCPKCDKLLEINKSNFYISSTGIICSKCIKCDNKATLSRRQTQKQKSLDYKGGKCVVCVYKKYQGALEFHHLDPSKKDFSIGNFNTFSMERLKPELDKCVILCSNCHKELHGGLIKLE